MQKGIRAHTHCINIVLACDGQETDARTRGKDMHRMQTLACRTSDAVVRTEKSARAHRDGQ
jgi:hypothetical protein